MPRFHRFQTAAFTATLLFIALAAPDAAAKCATERIDIAGGGLDQPISISDEDVVRQFFVYNGPGVRINDQPVHMNPDRQEGNFIFWPSGPVEAGGDRGTTYAVSFYCDFNGETHKLYEVDYRYASPDEPGYIFLPGHGDKRYGRNVSTIVHGVEGNWFHSTRQWDRLIRPIIDKHSS